MSCVLKCTIQETKYLQIDKYKEETVVGPACILSLILRFPPLVTERSVKMIVSLSPLTNLEVYH